MKDDNWKTDRVVSTAIARMLFSVVFYVGIAAIGGLIIQHFLGSITQPLISALKCIPR
jgi:hypothetical protein